MPLSCGKIDTNTILTMVDDEELCIIHVESGDVDRALEIIYATMEEMGDPKEKSICPDYWDYCTDVFQKELKRNNVKAQVWEVG